MYHEISPESHPSFRKYVVSPKSFGVQMRWLRTAGYNPITLDTLYASRIDAAVLPPRPVVITFDDGFRHCVRYAAEVLQGYAFSAVFFLVAGLVGRTSRWMIRERGIELPLADWTEARELLAAGFDCGAHSLTHPRLPSMPDAVCRDELETSRQILETGLRRKVVHLAYPFGAFDARVRALASEAGYHTACTTEIGLATSQDDPLALRRVPVTGQDTLPDFVWRLRTGRSLREAYQRWRVRPGALDAPHESGG